VIYLARGLGRGQQLYNPRERRPTTRGKKFTDKFRLQRPFADVVDLNGRTLTIRRSTRKRKEVAASAIHSHSRAKDTFQTSRGGDAAGSSRSRTPWFLRCRRTRGKLSSAGTPVSARPHLLDQACWFSILTKSGLILGCWRIANEPQKFTARTFNHPLVS